MSMRWAFWWWTWGSLAGTVGHDIGMWSAEGFAVSMAIALLAYGGYELLSRVHVCWGRDGEAQDG